MTEAPVRRRSYSQLTTYMECGEAYRLKYVERHAEDPAVWSIGGTAFHTCAEWYLRGDLGPDPTDDRIRNAWQVAWDLAYQEVIARNPEADPDPRTWRAANRGKENVGWWTVEGPEMVTRFIEWRQGRGRLLNVLELAGAPALEARLEVELGGVPVVAIPDALVTDEHGQVNVLDYKSGRKAPSSSLQLGVYRAATLAAFGVESTWGLYYMTRAGEVIPHDLNVWDPDHIGDLFARFDARERAGVYRPNPGPSCRFCGVREHCTYKGDA